MTQRTTMPREVYLVIHGHFYQPPRENPWLEAIEREPSAHPFPNWNARIAHECYLTNGWARVFNERGRICDLVNNYLHMSFNFGPTLLSWMEVAAPAIYERILDADRKSVKLRGGHGNAIAQAYGHAILPLCNDRDRLTQIRWGVRDFVHRFKRQPEALWLAETAIDAATVDNLIAEGMSYVILAPGQAHAVREIGKDKWHDVSGATIDPRRPYRCFSKTNPEKYIDVFFYDGPVSHSISFEKVLHSSAQFTSKLRGAVDQGRDGPQLVHAAVDGETFGHHMPHAERALSYAFTHEIPRRGLHLTNYGEYLERFPPTWEVELNYGPGGEGTAWSCAHGVGRWCRDCGCHTGAPEGWNQAWRAPLRQAVNLVRDQAATLFTEAGGDLFADPWAARDDYVELLLDGSPERREAFLERHSRDGRRVARQVRAFKLLEMQRYSLLAQTSCGWFFNDISGLEATQVLKYAARTVQLLEELSGKSVERTVMDVLAQAHSNIPHMGSGADVYQNLVLPASVSGRRLAAQYAITDMFRSYPDDTPFYGYQIQRMESHRLSSGPVSVHVGRIQNEFLRTGESMDMTYALIHFGGHDFHCAVRAFAGMPEFRAFIERLESIFHRATVTELLRAVDGYFGEVYYGLNHLLAEEREEVLEGLFGHLTERFAEMYTRLYQDNARTVNALVDTGLKVPREFRMAAEYTLSRQLNEEIRAQKGSRDPECYRRALEIIAEAELRGFTLEEEESQVIFGDMLHDAIHRLIRHPGPQPCTECIEIMKLAEMLRIQLPLEERQNLLFDWLVEEKTSPEVRAIRGDLHQLLEKMHLSTSLLR